MTEHLSMLPGPVAPVAVVEQQAQHLLAYARVSDVIVEKLRAKYPEMGITEVRSLETKPLPDGSFEVISYAVVCRSREALAPVRGEHWAPRLIKASLLPLVLAEMLLLGLLK